MTPQEWIDRINAISCTSNKTKQTQQFDVLLDELMNAWPISQLTEEEYSADFAVLRQQIIKSPREIVEFLLSVSEYRALWLVPLCVKYAIHDHGVGLRIDPWKLKHFKRFSRGWSNVIAKAYRSQD